ncbi:MAG: HDOD domain-containing protein [Candidatus Hydrogenedentes bacterium]|nr:HDOD domain-containing protein [Candidatus Hydrogenedentota bacterium]
MTKKSEILKKLEEIPALPTNTSSILRKIQDHEVPMTEIAKEIQTDPTLTSNLLKLANSAYFAGPKKISTIKEAVVMLGVNRVYQMIIASAIFPLALKPLKGYDLPAGELVRHLVGTAIISELLTKEIKIVAPPYTFTVGLLHDIGKIALGTFLELEIKLIIQKAYEEKISFEKAEKEVLGIDHAEAGAFLMKNWNFPDNLIVPVLYHHEPEKTVGEYQLVTDIIHISSNICIECGIGAGIDGLNYSNNPSSIERLGLSFQNVESIICKFISELNSVFKNLDMSA